MLTAGRFGLWALLPVALRTLEFAGGGGTAILAGPAGRDGLHFAAGLGIQPDRNSRVSAPQRWRLVSAKRLRKDLTNRLVTIFDKVARPDWTWFEDGLTYDNAKLAHALIVSGRATAQTGVYERGIQALRWLVGVQTSTAWTTPAHWQQRLLSAQRRTRRFRPAAHRGAEHNLGLSGSIPRNQPTCGGMNRPRRAFDWFLGWNDLGLELYAPETGGCRDGLHADRANENQGAESMLAFLLSLAEMRLIQNTASGIRRTGIAAPITQ